MKDSILVTGASGFVGKYLVEALEQRGEHVVTHSSRDGDLSRVEPVNQKVRHVYHLAARTYVPDSWRDPRGFYEVNVLGTVNVLEFCRKQAASLTLLSSYVYGQPDRLPIPEDHPLRASNPYGNSKILAENAAQFYQAAFRVPVNIVRPFNLYGPGQSGHFLIPKLISQALDPAGKTVTVEDTGPKRDYIFITDLIELLLLLDKPAGGVYNAGSGTSFTVQQVGDLVIRFAGTGKKLVSRDRKRQDEIMDTVADVSRAKLELSWSTRTSLEQGLQLTVDFMRQSAIKLKEGGAGCLRQAGPGCT
jgi:nucleoside-diphosphate-sugar epimerase